MKIFLDTANMEEIRKYNKMGLLDGITTNPTLLSREIGENPHTVMKDIAKLVGGDVSLEVISLKSEDMVKEGKTLRQYGQNVVVKCPMTGEGLRACAELTAQGIPVNITLIFSANQALLAAKAGARYVSPFIGRLDDIGQNGMQIIRDIRLIFSNYKMTTQILVASVRHPIHVLEAAKAGADVVTLPPAVLGKMLKHPLTDLGIEMFLADWKKTQN
ncbi:MAG: transaldolase [Cenarchaeum symbiont of Oopsacas minuta]|nr:transaldolase [Cenarchaeum symbiont of Oopsacas minuta]